jgi:sulfofructose kinase
VVGQNSLDRVYQVAEMPAPGVKTRTEAPRVGPGGTAATVALGCARLGLRCAYVGAVGDDAAAGAALAPLGDAGIDLSGVSRVPGAATREAAIWVDARSGERTILWHRDDRLAIATGAPVRDLLTRARAVLVDDEDLDASRVAASVARAAGVPVVLDSDRRMPGLDALLADVDFPIVAGSFADSFEEDLPVEAALRELSRQGAGLAVVTRGGEGAVARLGEREIRSPAFPVDVVDTTGAGDAFRAGFLWGLLEGMDAEGMLRAANAAAALNCTAPGAQGGLPDRLALEALLARAPARRGGA